MLGNSGDELTNMWGLITVGLAVAGIGFTLEHKAYRIAFFATGTLFVLSGLCWSPIRRALPTLGSVVTAVTQNPSNWFLVLVIAITAVWLHQYRREISKARITQETPKQQRASAKGDSVNWDIWKFVRVYTVYDFACVLAKDDPQNGAGGNEARTFTKLMLQDIRDGYLPYTRKVTNMNGSIIPDTEISRDAAVTWAEEHDFDVAHVK